MREDAMAVRRIAEGGVAVALVILALACRPPAAVGQAAACVTNDDADLVVVALRKGYGFNAADALTVVTNEAKCTSAVTAFNAALKLAGTPRAVTKAVVISASDTQYVVWSRDQVTHGERALLWFSPTWTLGRVAVF
jgi:hypothetical protein